MRLRSAGLAFMLLWIGATTLVLSAAAAWIKAGSGYGALAFLVAGLLLAPPVQDLVGRITHVLLPGRLAFIAAITLVPLGGLLVAIQAVAALDVEARTRGFASAGQMARARDLGLSTPAALAAHEEEARRKADEALCRSHGAKQPLTCLPADHRLAAEAYARRQLDGGVYEQVVREAIGQQRTAFLAADKSCAALVDRMDEDAIPHILANKSTGVAMAAVLWARALSQAELEKLLEQSKPGVSYLRTGGADALEQKVAALAKTLDRAFDTELQAWARQVVADDTTWRALFGGRAPIGACKPAAALAGP